MQKINVLRGRERFDVYRLVHAISLKKLIHLGFFSSENRDRSIKGMEFFQLVKQREVTDDESAIKIMKFKSKKSFDRFKQRFTSKLKSYLFVIELHSFDVKREDLIHKELWSDLALCKILEKVSQNKNAIALYFDIYKKAKKHELIRPMLHAVRELRTYYSFYQPNKTKYSVFKQEYDHCIDQFQKYELVTQKYDEVSHLNVFQDLLNDLNIGDLSLGYYKELKTLFNKNDFIPFRIRSYQIGIYAYQMQKDYKRALETSLEALEYLDSKTEERKLYRYLILLDVLRTNLLLKDYKHCLSIVEKIESIGLSFNFNYFKLQSLKFHIFVLEFRYRDLYDLTTFIINRPELSKYAFRHEQWKINEAFVHFLIQSDKIPGVEPDSSNFKLSKFINSINIQDKDKRGVNIALHVVQLLFYLKQKKFSKVNERLEALTLYSFRYLRRDETLRSNCFIKMCLKLPEAEYNPIRTKRYVKKYWDRLLENPFELSLQSTEVEIIPYEQLWEMIIETISVKK